MIAVLAIPALMLTYHLFFGKSEADLDFALRTTYKCGPSTKEKAARCVFVAGTFP